LKNVAIFISDLAELGTKSLQYNNLAVGSARISRASVEGKELHESNTRMRHMTDEAQAAAKIQERLKGDSTIPQGGGEGGKEDTTTSGTSGSTSGSADGKQGPASDAAPNLKPRKPGDS
jgi:hypothetical protein